LLRWSCGWLCIESLEDASRLRTRGIRDCAKYMVLSLPRPCEVPVEITRDKIVEDAFKNGTYATLGVQLARFPEQDRRNNEPISYKPRFPTGINDPNCW